MNNQIRPYDPLTSENAALALIDHQVGLTGVRDYSTGELKHNVVALAKAAKALKLPNVVTTTARDSMWGPRLPELVEALPAVEIIDRSTVNAFDDKRVAGAIAATRCKTQIFRRYLSRSLRDFSGDHCRRERTGRLPSGRCFGEPSTKRNVRLGCGGRNRRRHRLGLRDFDGGNSQGQWATGSRHGLPGHGHAWAKLVGQIAHAYGK